MGANKGVRHGARALSMKSLAPRPDADSKCEKPTGKASRLTRREVAELLQVSVSTVRRMEGTRLVPEVREDGTRLFSTDQVEAIGAAVTRSVGIRSHWVGEQRLSPGELAAEVFERFEQRQSLSEIVRTLRVRPKRVRALYHEWRLCLELGELQRNKEAAPARETLTSTYSRFVENLDELLATLPPGVRVSVARFATEWSTDVEFEAVIYEELGGFLYERSVSSAQLRQQYGDGKLRVTAYSLQESRILWEVYSKV
jgi:hypothetical protein